MRRLFTQFSFPGGIPSHVAPGDARFDPRGRRARLLAVPRLRRGLRQPGPGGGGGRRRRRGRDRPAGDELARHQVRRPAPRRRRAADPAPQRLQDRQPDRAGPDPRGGAADAALRGYGHTPYVVEGDDPATMHQAFAATLDRCLDEIAEHPARGPAASGTRRAAAWPMIVLRIPEGLDRPEGGRRPAGRGLLALAPGAVRRRPRTTRATARSSRSGCAATGPRSCSTPTARRSPEIARPAPRRAPADERQPARQRRPAAARPADARLPRLRRAGRRAGHRRGRGDPRARARSCAT